MILQDTKYKYKNTDNLVNGLNLKWVTFSCVIYFTSCWEATFVSVVISIV